MALSFAVKMDDKVSPAAGSAAHQVKVLSSAMAGLQNAMIKANAMGNDKAFGKAATAYGAMKQQVDSLGGPMAKTAASTKSMSLASKMGAMSLNAYVEMAKTAVDAFIGLAQAIGNAFVAVMQFVQGRKALQGSMNALTADGGATMKMLDDLSQRLPFTTDEMGKWVKQMAAAGVKDLPRLAQATKAAAASSAIMGDATGQAGEKIVGLVTDINRAIQTRQGIGDLRGALEGTGVTIDEVAKAAGVSVRQLNMMAASGRQLNKIGNVIQDALITKGKPAMKDMMLTWDNLTKRFHDGMAQLMSGVADTPGFKSFVHSLQTVVMLFSGGQKNATGMKGAATKLFDAMFKLGAKVVTALTIGFLTIRVTMQGWYISMLPTLNILGDFYRKAKKIGLLSDLWEPFGEVLDVVATGIWNLARPFVMVGAAVAALITGLIWLVGQASITVKKIIKAIKEPFNNLKNWFFKKGGNIAKGLIDGMLGNTEDIGEAAAAMAKAAKDGVAEPLEIHSPSRVMYRFGKNAGAGLSGGLEDSAPKVRMSSEGMAGATVGGVARGAAGKAGGGVTVHVQSGAIVIQGGGGQGMAELLEEGIADLFERIALTQGLGAGVA